MCKSCQAPVINEVGFYICSKCHGMVTGVCDGFHAHPSEKNWRTTLLLAIFLGVFGGHRFYVDKRGTGWLMLLLCWTGISVLWAVFDIIKIVTESFEDDLGCIIHKAR